MVFPRRTADTYSEAQPPETASTWDMAHWSNHILNAAQLLFALQARTIFKTGPLTLISERILETVLTGTVLLRAVATRLCRRRMLSLRPSVAF
jgi:hypothetical protein